MGWARETVGAAVLAAAIGVDRAVKADVGRFVAGDDLPRPLLGDIGPEGGKLLKALPAVVEGDLGVRLEAAARIGDGAATAAALAADRGVEYAIVLIGVIRRLIGRRFVEAPVHGFPLSQP